MKDSRFDDIRPYYEDEVPAAINRIAECHLFPLFASYLYPELSVEEARRLVKGFKTRRDFQFGLMVTFIQQFLSRSVGKFTYHGVENLDKSKSYLFVSNHRDIVLDSTLLQYIMYQNGFDTTEITFGSNLMCNPIIIDIGKVNKMFRVERGGNMNMKEFYKSSMHLSEYLRYVITTKQQSAWIAQRNGRTKDGIDRTDQGIIKMFCMSMPNDKIRALSELNIVPLSISYEWEPCDILKALELYQTREAKYFKKPGEDLNSIVTGITDYKGDVHLEIGKPISEEQLREFDGCTNSEYHKKVAQLLDETILSNYKLSHNNYIANDLRYGREQYRNLYTEDQYQAFVSHVERLNKYADECNLEILRDIFLGIYSNPV